MAEEQELNTVIVGGGHCGLNLALNLEEGTRSYIVLEKGEIMNQWKHGRWDGFMVNLSYDFSKLHGQNDPGVDGKAMGRPLKDDIDRWQRHVVASGVKYREKTEVVSVVLLPSGKFETTVRNADGSSSTFVSLNVVGCNGNYDYVKVPEQQSKALAASVHQITSDTYRNTKQLKDGNVLIVGCGQTGLQLAEAITDRKVFLCTSMQAGAVRTYRGDDIFYWMDRVGFLGMSRDDLTKAFPPEKAMAMQYGHDPLICANHACSLFSLHRKGVAVLGGLGEVAADGITCAIQSRRNRNVTLANNTYLEMGTMFEGWIAANGKDNDFPPAEFPEPAWVPVEELLESDGPTELSLSKEGITNVIWATGYVPKFDWVKVPGILEGFDPISKKPLNLDTAVPGFFFSGFPWQNHCMSPNILGFDRDHKVILSKLRDDA